MSDDDELAIALYAVWLGEPRTVISADWRYGIMPSTKAMWRRVAAEARKQLQSTKDLS